MSQVIPSADEPIRDFVRSRLDVAVPPSLTTDVMRSVMDTVDTRTSRFSPLFAGISAAVAVALLFATALWVSGPRNIGPDPAPSPSPQPTATPAPTLTPENALSLVRPGDVVRLAAQDAEGRYGTIILERGDERAGYPGMEMYMIWPEGFFIEVHVRYEIDRPTSQPYGFDDWSFRLTEPTSASDMTGAYISYDYPAPGVVLLPRRQNGETPIEGTVVFALPVDAAEVPVAMVYGDDVAPLEDPVPLAEITLRNPGPPVGTSLAPTPRPDATVEPMPSPTPHAEADALFAETEVCRSEAGYVVEFPAAWYTNPTLGDLPACSRFAPVPFSTDVDEPASDVAIVIERRTDDPILGDGFDFLGAWGAGVDGVRSIWWERESIESPLLAAGERTLYYEVFLDGEAPYIEPGVEWIYAGTTTLSAANEADYELNKAVLHRIMATMDITDR